jgi:hypothetical protein
MLRTYRLHRRLPLYRSPVIIYIHIYSGVCVKYLYIYIYIWGGVTAAYTGVSSLLLSGSGVVTLREGGEIEG